MVNLRIIAFSIISILLCTNITQFTLNRYLKLKISTQNTAILKEQQEREKLVKQREIDLKKLSDKYQQDLNKIKNIKLPNDNLSCSETLDLIVESMQGINGMPDNP